MSLLSFDSSSKGPEKRIQRFLEDKFSFRKNEVCKTISSLLQKLCKPMRDLDIAILLVRSSSELDDLISISHLFDDVRIILILPDRKSETISKGHLLRPRFLTFIDSDFIKTVAVLDMILASTCSSGHSGRKVLYLKD